MPSIRGGANSESPASRRKLGSGEALDWGDSVDLAFLPMNLPYTMTSEQVAEAARVIRPRILYPYHFGNTDTGVISKLLANEPGIELRLRKLQ